MKLAGKIKPEIADELSVRSIEFSAKTKTSIDYLKKFEKEKKKKTSDSKKATSNS